MKPSHSRSPSWFPQKQLKMVMLGDSGVGKSALLETFAYNKFSGEYSPTVGVDYFPLDF